MISFSLQSLGTMMFEYWQEGLLILVGCVAGFLNVMAGGGSLLTVPVMVFLGMPGPVANGTNRIALLAQNITAVTTFFKKGFADFKLSLTLSLATLPGAVAGAYAGTRLDGVWFNRVLAGVMLMVMILMRVKSKVVRNSSQTPQKISFKRLLWAHILMLGAGAYGGFIQIGAGFILMPILYRVLGLDLVRVNMHKVFIVMSYTSVALWVYASELQLMWVMGACLALGNSIGGWLGAHTTVNRGEKWIKIILNIVIVLFIVKLLFSNAV